MERCQETELQDLFDGLAAELQLPALAPNGAGQVALHSDEHHLTTMIWARFQERRYEVQLEADVFPENDLELPQLKTLLARVGKLTSCGLILDAQQRYAVRQHLLLQMTDPVEHLMEALKSFIGEALQLRHSLVNAGDAESQWSSEHILV